MSDFKNISPLLDGFQLGAPICEHSGVICRPAIKENSNKKYIVKIISIPASQSQFDAMLLAGAYKDPAEAMDYFRKLGESILGEAEHLRRLSKLEGFLPYDGWQMEPITRRRLGYEVYLVGSYKRSLEKYIKKNAFTHLEAINLSLDLCSALSVCRQTGYLYVDLKPSNIYISENKQYRIGDLGFLNMDSLRYASLPDRYHSPYTPPELLDPMTPMNLSVDTYPVGMILYQLYNDGHLPFSGLAPTDPLPPPIHANYELAEIIMKAIDPDPEKRWMDPKDMGKAIASYMQRNRVNDLPITPFIPLDVEPEAIIDTAGEKAPDITGTEMTVTVTDSDTASPNEDLIPTDSPNSVDTEQETSVEPTVAEEGEAPVQTAETPESDFSEITDREETADEYIEVAVTTEKQTIPAVETASQSETEEENLSEEVIRIIAKANELIVHEIPEEMIFPAEPAADPFMFAFEDSEDLNEDISDNSLTEDQWSDVEPNEKKKTKHFADNTRSKKIKRFFISLFFILLLSAMLAGGFWFYLNVYLQTIDSMSASATQDQLTVLIDTDVDESGLIVNCTDSKGKQHTASVKGGKAVLSGLQPSTEYTVTVKSTGFHKLVGKTSEVFTTESTTQILTFDAIAGSEDGSVLLEFTVDGDEPDFWNVRYTTDGEEERLETITTHSTMISGLTAGKVYTFTLDGGKNFDLSGNTAVKYMASKLILAENLNAVSDNGTDVWVYWDTPGDVVIDHWNVRCYDSYGYEEQITVTDTKALFNGLDSTSSYVVEVTASGMTKPQCMNITADPICVSAFQIDESSHKSLNITWEFTGNKPKDGWTLLYTIDGSGDQTIVCEKEIASIAPLIPGATYDFTVQANDGTTVFNNQYSHATAEAEVFADNNVIPENLSIDLLKTPQADNWTYESLQDVAFTDTFAAGESASMVLRSSSVFYLPGYETKVLFVLRNSYGNVLPEFVSEETYYWKNIWLAGDSKIGELDIPALPVVPGNYVVELYFNGKSVTQLDIKITE